MRFSEKTRHQVEDMGKVIRKHVTLVTLRLYRRQNFQPGPPGPGWAGAHTVLLPRHPRHRAPPPSLRRDGQHP